jgi:hypothetical protein
VTLDRAHDRAGSEDDKKPEQESEDRGEQDAGPGWALRAAYAGPVYEFSR